MANSKAPIIWSDIHHHVEKDSRGAVHKVVNVESVLTSIDNILGTYPSERVMLPTFASKLRNILFEPIDQTLVDKIQNDIKATIERWDDRVTVLGVNVYTNPDNSFIQISLNINIRGYSKVFSIEKKLK